LLRISWSKRCLVPFKRRRTYQVQYEITTINAKKKGINTSDIVSFAVLAQNSENWAVPKYHWERWCSVDLASIDKAKGIGTSNIIIWYAVVAENIFEMDAGPDYQR